MEYTKLGNTGMDVSRICLGCMSFGSADSGFHKWTLGEEDSRVIVKRALDLGINFFDTANCYSYGSSEEILGRAIKDYANRDEVVVATKVFIPMREGRNGGGLSRKHIMAEIDHSLKRLGMDYVDLYIIHRWDYSTPIEETMEALHDIVKAGKARYIGASAMFAWQFAKAQFTAQMHGWTKFISMQNHYNLIYREEEREMIPLCEDMKVASTPYSPLASGRLSRGANADTARSKNDPIQSVKYGTTEAEDQIIIDRVAEIAEKRGITRTQTALAWLLHKPAVASPVIGATKLAHLDDSAGAVGVVLSPEEMQFLEEAYVPHRITGAIVPDSIKIHGVQV
ncbi:MAG: aldo/keto reductase [Defluviitaleaceae bacterium]|nr:aldo/keto reductase [Defluviitaleaceae bacterium]MCL2274532.1 aldo/keto reductase [Defluviitaleaceae bacterium]